MKHRLAGLAALAFWMLAAAAPAHAHKGSDAYLDVQQAADATALDAGSAASYREFRLGLAVAVKDLDLLLPLDANADGKVTWGEARASIPQVLALANSTAQLEAALPEPAAASPAALPCQLAWQADGLDRRSDGVYVRLVATARCPAAQALQLRYTLLRDQDANHRLLVAGRLAGRELLTTASPLQPGPVLLAPGSDPAAAQPGNASAPAGAAAPSGRWSALRDYFVLGMHHLLEGYDHLAFLLALVLPLRLRLFAGGIGQGRAGSVAPAAGGGPGQAHAVWCDLLRTVTAFTVGHSVTLALSTLGWTQASPLWVEPVIALSIAVAALLNLWPLRWVRTDALALVFGMVHGFGFAGLLQEAAAPGGLLPWALAGFNIGVEAGQLLAVSAWVLLSQALVTRPWYPRVVVRGGSVLLALLAAWWFWERVS